jgi:hypothetical protein
MANTYKNNKTDLSIYIGVYRVKYEKDYEGNNLESMYIPCKSSKKDKIKTEIYRYSEDKLNIIIPSKRKAENIKKELPNVFTTFLECGSGETILQFDEKYIDEVAKIIEVKTQGKNILPKNKRSYKDKSQVQHGTASQYGFGKKKIVGGNTQNECQDCDLSKL